MEVSYKRNRGFSYLILSEDSQMAGPHYQKAIFLENAIPGLLSCKIQRLNGEESFCYDITGCQSLKNLYIVKPEWITESVSSGKRLNESSFSLFSAKNPIQSMLVSRSNRFHRFLSSKIGFKRVIHTPTCLF